MHLEKTMIIKAFYYYKDEYKKGFAANLASVSEHLRSPNGYRAYLKRKPKSNYLQYARQMIEQGRAVDNPELIAKGKQKYEFLNSGQEVEFFGEESDESDLHLSLVLSDDNLAPEKTPHPEVYAQMVFYKWLEMLPPKWNNAKHWKFYGARHLDTANPHLHLVIYRARGAPDVNNFQFRQLWNKKTLLKFKQSLNPTVGIYGKSQSVREKLFALDYSKLDPYSNSKHKFLLDWAFSIWFNQDKDPKVNKIRNSIFKHKNWSAPIKVDLSQGDKIAKKEQDLMSMALAHKQFAKYFREYKELFYNLMTKQYHLIPKWYEFSEKQQQLKNYTTTKEHHNDNKHVSSHQPRVDS